MSGTKSPSQDNNNNNLNSKPPSFVILRELASAGCTNATSSTILNPMDVCKIRMQTEGALERNVERKYRTLPGTLRLIFKEEGILGLWLPGLMASILREMSYSSIRMGLYTPIKKIVVGKSKKKDIGLTKKVVIGLLTGAIGSAIATPTDLVNKISTRSWKNKKWRLCYRIKKRLSSNI